MVHFFFLLLPIFNLFYCAITDYNLLLVPLHCYDLCFSHIWVAYFTYFQGFMGFNIVYNASTITPRSIQKYWLSSIYHMFLCFYFWSMYYIPLYGVSLQRKKTNRIWYMHGKNLSYVLYYTVCTQYKQTPSWSMLIVFMTHAHRHPLSLLTMTSLFRSHGPLGNLLLRSVPSPHCNKKIVWSMKKSCDMY